MEEKIIPYMKPMVVFIKKNKENFFWGEKKNQNGCLNKTSSSSSANFHFFLKNPMDWSLGSYNEMM